MKHSPQKTSEDTDAGAHIDPQSPKKEIKTGKDNGYPKKPNRPYPGFRKNFCEYFSEYSNNTSIHGFKYMGEREKTIFERLWWLVLFSISLYICVDLIIQSYNKWAATPILVSFTRSPTPVWQVPFPAITVCSEVKVRQTVYNFTENYHRIMTDSGNMTDEEKKKFFDMALICKNHIDHEGNITTGSDTIEFLMSVAPEFDEMFWTCKYALLNETCQDFFTPILTEQGLCHTFNMLDRSELFRGNVFLPDEFLNHGKKSEGWSLETGYLPNFPINPYPRRAISAGLLSGFYLLLRVNQKDMDFVCSQSEQAFKILLHNPADIPKVGMQYIRVPLNKEFVLVVKPDIMTSSDGLKKCDTHRRQCYFPKERHLAFFQSYTQQNCDVECLTNATRKKCGCVAYHMPREEDTPICGPGSFSCMWNAQTELMRQEIHTGLNRDETIVNRTSECDCLPGCTSIVYNAETSEVDFMWEELFNAYHVNLSEFSGYKFTRVHIFFKEHQFITSERSELYGPTIVDFLANCGGLLGLFTGFSFLSIVEILYFLSLRLMCNVIRYGRDYWSGSPDLVNNDMYIHKK